jgi:hypothetical protein
VADGWCWFILREKFWLVAGGWFVLREKYCWLVADKPSEHAVNRPQTSLPLIASETYIYRMKDSLLDTILASSEASNVYLIWNKLSQLMVVHHRVRRLLLHDDVVRFEELWHYLPVSYPGLLQEAAWQKHRGLHGWRGCEDQEPPGYPSRFLRVKSQEPP